MAASIPSHAPLKFYQGETVKWTTSLPDYLPAVGWALSYRFARLGGTIEIDATDNGDGTHLVTIPASAGTPPSSYDTSDFATGEWSYIGIVGKAGESFVVDTGHLTVLPSHTEVIETRSEAKQNLDAIQAAIDAILATPANARMASYSISWVSGGSRSVVDRTLTELFDLRDRVRSEYQAELNAERQAKGLANPRHVRVRLDRA